MQSGRLISPRVEQFLAEHTDPHWQIVRHRTERGAVQGAIHYQPLILASDRPEAFVVDQLQVYAENPVQHRRTRDELLQQLQKQQRGTVIIISLADYCPPYEGAGYYAMRRYLADEVATWTNPPLPIWQSMVLVSRSDTAVVAWREGNPVAFLTARQSAQGRVQGTKTFDAEEFLASPKLDQELLRSHCLWGVDMLWGRQMHNA